MKSLDFASVCLPSFTSAVPKLDINFTHDPSPSSQDSDADFKSSDCHSGVPSEPRQAFRTRRPTEPEDRHISRELRPVFDHAIADVWDTLGPQVLRYLDTVNLMWTSIDVVRFAYSDEKVAGPPVLWIGVMPDSLSCEDAETVGVGCKGLLTKFELIDVEVEFRESVFTRLVAPHLLNHDPSHVTASLRGPLTPTLGLPISARPTAQKQGTAGLYVRESSDTGRVFLLTARHVVLPPGESGNELFDRKHVSQRRVDVLLGPQALEDVLSATTTRKDAHEQIAEGYEKKLRRLQLVAADGEGDVAQNEQRDEIQSQLQEAKDTVETLEVFYTEVDKWSQSQPVIGQISYSPPISCGTGVKRFTEDWALIQLDDKMIDWTSFNGNVIDLGTDISADEFNNKMHQRSTTVTHFKYPLDHLLRLRGVVRDDELRRPPMRDENGERCLFVIKNGAASGVTIGRATPIESYVRVYETLEPQTSMELPIFGYSKEDGAFSCPGDSGSIVADPTGRIVSLITGGAGPTNSVDVTYSTPFYWLLERIKTRFPNACVY